MKNSNENYKIQAQLAIDPTFRQIARENPALALKQLDYEADDGVRVKFVENTKTKYYVVLWGQEYKHQEMLELSAAGTTGTVGSVSTASTVGSVLSTLGSAGSIGSVGTAGTGG